MRTALSWILPAFFTLVGGPAWARSPERITFPVSITWDVGPGNNVYLVGSHPDVGSWSPVNAHKLRWTTGNNWTGQVAVQAGTALEFKFISRNGASNQYCNGANVVWEGGANRTTNLPAAAGAPFTGKTIFYYSSWTSATLVTAASNAYPFTRVGPGRTGGEYLHRVDGVPEEGEPLEFAINGSLGGVSGWDKPPPGDGWGVNGNYYTTLDVFLIQEGQIYTYWPSNTMSAPSSETRVVNSSYATITGRTIRIYLPRGYTNHPWKRYPVIYMQDGQNMADPANPGAPRPTAQQDLWHYTMAKMVDACASVGALPFYGPFGDIADLTACEDQFRNAYLMGCVGAWSLHPNQIAIAKRVFSPKQEEVAWAKRVIEAMPDGSGAVMIDGKMQDDATWKQCKVVFNLAKLIASRDAEYKALYGF